MRLDLTSMAFGYVVKDGGATPNWATSLGQGAEYKIQEQSGAIPLLPGLVFSSVPLSSVTVRKGKGGSTFIASDPLSGVVLASLFKKIYVNGILIPGTIFILYIDRDDSQSHSGRLRLKYSRFVKVKDGSKEVSNEIFPKKVEAALGMASGACWFVYDISIRNQDELLLSAVIVDKDKTREYASAASLKDNWGALLPSETALLPKDIPFQLITYGAPGTGKSFKIRNETTGQKVFRTTFHPDSDYATFVGAYKPVMKEVERTVLVGKKLEMADVGSVKEELKKESVISYEFVEQVFTKAYIEAWGCQKAAKADEEPKRVYLVIEEINRGNCAQIFGDLFQLLDRNGKGFSEYPIRPDSDFGKHIATALGKKEGTFDEGRKARINALYPEVEEGVDIVDEVLSGRYLLLPGNLFIRATMNTSDQSLFPMDSAFKRRWDWDYIPIEDHPEEDWEIEIDSSTHYRWWDFLDAINKEIFKATSSEDKQLGYFFVRAKGGKIDLDTFVSKVVFYLWNSVFKDCYTDCEFMKKDKDHYFIFTSFFKSGKPDAEQAKAFLGNLKGVKSVEAKEDETTKAEAKAQADGEVASDGDGQSTGNG